MRPFIADGTNPNRIVGVPADDVTNAPITALIKDLTS